MEPYCADITNEEVRTLEELLKPPEDEAEHYKVETLSLNRQGRKRGLRGASALKLPKPYIIFLSLPCPVSCLPHYPTQTSSLSSFSRHCLPSIPSRWLLSNSVRLSLVCTSPSPLFWFKTSISFHPNRFLILPASKGAFFSLKCKSLFFDDENKTDPIKESVENRSVGGTLP